MHATWLHWSSSGEPSKKTLTQVWVIIWNDLDDFGNIATVKVSFAACSWKLHGMAWKLHCVKPV